jgi:hypothetical protein
MTPGSATTVDAALLRASDAYMALVGLAEDVDDEWSYIQDLWESWRGRLETVRAERGDATVDPAVDAAIVAVVAEAGRIVDPHRAIDWLSTFPQVVLIALGERP